MYTSIHFENWYWATFKRVLGDVWATKTIACTCSWVSPSIEGSYEFRSLFLRGHNSYIVFHHNTDLFQYAEAISWSMDSTKINYRMFLSLRSKICRAGMVVSPIYITFYWLQEFCIIIEIENVTFWILRCFIYQLIHPVLWNRYIKNIFPTILQSIWHSCTFLVLKWNWYIFLFPTIFFNQFWYFMKGRQTSSLLYSPSNLPLPFLW